MQVGMNRSRKPPPASGASNYAEKDLMERQAQDFFKFIKQRQNWNSVGTRLQFEQLYYEHCRQRKDAVQFDANFWTALKILVEGWFFIRYLRSRSSGERKLTKEQLRCIYIQEYRPHLVDRTGGPDPRGGVADFGKVLKSALYRGKLIELGGYVYVGDTEAALAEALTEAPDPAELARRAAKKTAQPDRYCEVCDVACRDPQQLQEHLSGRRHKAQQAIGELRNPAVKRALISDKGDLVVSADVEFDPASGTFTLETEVGKRSDFSIRVENRRRAVPINNPFVAGALAASGGSQFASLATSSADNTVVIEEFLYLFKVDGVYFNDANSGLIRGRPITLAAGQSFALQVISLPQNFASRSVIPILFVFRERSSARQFRLLRFVKIECVEDKALYDALKPETIVKSAGYSNVSEKKYTETVKPKQTSKANNQQKRVDEQGDGDLSTPVAAVRPQPRLLAAAQHDAPKKATSNEDEALQRHFAKLSVKTNNAATTTSLSKNANSAKATRTADEPDEVTKPKMTGWRNQVGQMVVPSGNYSASANRQARPGTALVQDVVRMEGKTRVVQAPALEPIHAPVANGLRLRALGEYAVPEKFERLHEKGLRTANTRGIKLSIGDEVMHNVLRQKTDESNFAERFDMLLYLEEVQMRIDLQRYTIDNAELSTVRDGEYILIVPGVVEHRPQVIRGDLLRLTLDSKPDTVYEAVVESVEICSEQSQRGVTAKLHLRTGTSFNYLKKQKDASVSFTFDRMPLRFQHETLLTLHALFSLSAAQTAHPNMLSTGNAKQEVDIGRLRALLFPSHNRYSAFKRQPSGVAVKSFFNPNLNEEQQRCVLRIVSGDHYPVPFLIFGPAGTGKTVTLSEAVRQIHSCLPRSFVLVCAPENTSADHVVQTLLAYGRVQRREILRLYAASRHKAVPDFISSGKCGHEFLEDGYPDAATLQSYRIVVTTLNTASRLVYSGFPRHHFTHLFIDEAGHAMEPEALVPIVGLLDLAKESGGQLVMAGDPRQLGVTVRSNIALEYNLEVSFLERLVDPRGQQKPGFSNIYYVERNSQVDMHRNLDSADGMLLNIPPSAKVRYDDRVLVKLRRNYRSHDAIIGFSREWFYHKELDACADKLSRDAFTNWEELPNKNFPVVFHPVVGADEHDAASPSFFNRHEVTVIDSYLKALLVEKRGGKVEPKDIGIISPYMGQNKKIQKLIEMKGYNAVGRNVSASTTRSDVGILVGTVEEFQGQERTVIIISTVRSSEKLLRKDGEYQVGFVDCRNREGFNVCSKRFNVAITRAKSLLVVVGNPFILEKDMNWKRWLVYCEENNAWKIPRSRFEKQRSAALVNDVLVDDSEGPEDSSATSVVELQEEPRWVRRE